MRRRRLGDTTIANSLQKNTKLEKEYLDQIRGGASHLNTLLDCESDNLSFKNSGTPLVGKNYVYTISVGLVFEITDLKLMNSQKYSLAPFVDSRDDVRSFSIIERKKILFVKLQSQIIAFKFGDKGEIKEIKKKTGAKFAENIEDNVYEDIYPDELAGILYYCSKTSVLAVNIRNLEIIWKIDIEIDKGKRKRPVVYIHHLYSGDLCDNIILMSRRKAIIAGRRNKKILKKVSLWEDTVSSKGAGFWEYNAAIKFTVHNSKVYVFNRSGIYFFDFISHKTSDASPSRSFASPLGLSSNFCLEGVVYSNNLSKGVQYARPFDVNTNQWLPEDDPIIENYRSLKYTFVRQLLFTQSKAFILYKYSHSKSIHFVSIDPITKKINQVFKENAQDIQFFQISLDRKFICLGYKRTIKQSFKNIPLPYNLFMTWSLVDSTLQITKSIDFVPLRLFEGQGIDCIYAIRKNKFHALILPKYSLVQFDIMTGESTNIYGFDDVGFGSFQIINNPSCEYLFIFDGNFCHYFDQETSDLDGKFSFGGQISEIITCYEEDEIYVQSAYKKNKAMIRCYQLSSNFNVKKYNFEVPTFSLFSVYPRLRIVMTPSQSYQLGEKSEVVVAENLLPLNQRSFRVSVDDSVTYNYDYKEGGVYIYKNHAHFKTLNLSIYKVFVPGKYHSNLFLLNDKLNIRTLNLENLNESFCLDMPQEVIVSLEKYETGKLNKRIFCKRLTQVCKISLVFALNVKIWEILIWYGSEDMLLDLPKKMWKNPIFNKGIENMVQKKKLNKKISDQLLGVSKLKLTVSKLKDAKDKCNLI